MDTNSDQGGWNVVPHRHAAVRRRCGGLDPAAAAHVEEEGTGGGEHGEKGGGIGPGAGEHRHRFKVHAEPAADEERRNHEGGEGGKHADAFAGFETGFVEVNAEGEDELVGPGSGGGLDALQILAEVAEVRDDDLADERGFALGELGDDTALGADDLAELGELFAEAENAGEEVFGGGTVEGVFFDFLEFAAELVEGGLVGLDHEVEDGVGEAVGSADGLGGVAAGALEGGADGVKVLGMVGEEEGFAEDEVELGGGEFIGAGVVHRVHDEEEVVVEGVEFRHGVIRGAVLDDERVEGEELFEDEAGFFGGGGGEIDPEHDVGLGA